MDTLELQDAWPTNACRLQPGAAAPGRKDAATEGDARLAAVTVEEACARACAAIAPIWPLDRAIAVNPHWHRIGMPVRRVAARMAALGGIAVFPPRESQRAAWQEGRITPDDLEEALVQLPAAQAAGLSAATCIAALDASLPLSPLPLLVDTLDQDPMRHTRLSWRAAITQQVSQTCAAYFDQHQADWQPDRAGGLYGFWRETLQHDHSIGLLMGLPHLGRHTRTLPVSRATAETWVLERLALPEAVWSDYLEAVLLTVNGWASWCAYLGWQAGLEGRTDEHLRDLLAIRLAWGVLLLESRDDPASRRATEAALAAVRTAWQAAPRRFQEFEEQLLVDEIWQLALEIGYQRRLASGLRAPCVVPAARDVEVQAAFCIDVRSERLRRAIERAWPSVQTIGFAGFFGLPLAYTPLGTRARRPQLPGLLAPGIEVTDRVVTEGFNGPADAAAERRAVQRRHDYFAAFDAWRAATRWPGAAFSFVEAAGVSYLPKLTAWLRPRTAGRPHDDQTGLSRRDRHRCQPHLTGLDRAERVALAARVLRAMGLQTELAPLVVFVGHGSQTANNAHAAALDCGACGGQTGEVNARALAGLLNDPDVRAGLAEHGTVIPAGTVFLSALHNTTTDEVEFFDVERLPASARPRCEQLRMAFVTAGHAVRCERAPALRLASQESSRTLLWRFRARANDGAETRPEWGLAGNAAFIIAPRERTRGITLSGRAFLHDYDAASDADGSVLELLLTAPMVVTHWINWQYHASRCDPARLGSGNKVLHNVVGGTIGVFEGNAGDLRIGLSRQALHDGAHWTHEPLRLTVAIDAPRASIGRVLARHAVVRHLVENDWLHLWRFGESGLEAWRSGVWRPVDLPASGRDRTDVSFASAQARLISSPGQRARQRP